MVLIKLDLPLPFGPIIVTISLHLILKLISSRTILSPNFSVIFLISKRFSMRIICIFFTVAILCTNLANANNKLIIATTVKPLELIISDITDSGTEVFSLLSEHDSAHSSNISMGKMQKLASANILFVISKDFDKSLANVKTNAKIVEIAKDPRIKLISSYHHGAKETDYHIWLNPDNAVVIAQIVAEELSNLAGVKNLDAYANLEVFKNEVGRQVNKMRKLLPELKKFRYYTFHNEFAYLTDFYGLNPFHDLHVDHHSGLSVAQAKQLYSLSGDKKSCVIASDEHKTSKNISFFQTNKIRYVFIDAENYTNTKYLDRGYRYAKMLEGIYNLINNCYEY